MAVANIQGFDPTPFYRSMGEGLGNAVASAGAEIGSTIKTVNSPDFKLKVEEYKGKLKSNADLATQKKLLIEALTIDKMASISNSLSKDKPAEQSVETQPVSTQEMSMEQPSLRDPEALGVSKSVKPAQVAAKPTVDLSKREEEIKKKYAAEIELMDAEQTQATAKGAQKFNQIKEQFESKYGSFTDNGLLIQEPSPNTFMEMGAADPGKTEIEIQVAAFEKEHQEKEDNESWTNRFKELSDRVAAGEFKDVNAENITSEFAYDKFTNPDSPMYQGKDFVRLMNDPNKREQFKIAFGTSKNDLLKAEETAAYRKRTLDEQRIKTFDEKKQQKIANLDGNIEKVQNDVNEIQKSIDTLQAAAPENYEEGQREELIRKKELQLSDTKARQKEAQATRDYLVTSDEKVADSAERAMLIFDGGEGELEKLTPTQIENLRKIRVWTEEHDAKLKELKALNRGSKGIAKKVADLKAKTTEQPGTEITTRKVTSESGTLTKKQMAQMALNDPEATPEERKQAKLILGIK